METTKCEREIVGENFEKRKKQVRNNKKMWEENFGRDSRRKKNKRGRKFRKIAFCILPLHVAFFFLSHLIKYLFYIFFNLSNVESILSI